MKQVFPKEILESTEEVYYLRQTVNSKIIYLLILAIPIFLFGSLKFFKIDIYTNARGILKSNKDRVPLTVINSGKIIFNKLKNNTNVAQGDTLLLMDYNDVDSKLELFNYQLRETTDFIRDIELLLDPKSFKDQRIKSSLYQRKQSYYHQNLLELKKRFQNAERDFNRYKILYDKGVISKSEYERKEFDFDIALSNIHQFREEQKNLLQSDLVRYRNTIEELKSYHEELIKKKTQFVVTAPVNGTLFTEMAFEPEYFISAGTQLGEISPNGELLAECYINSSEIGLLREKGKVELKIDAYNYNQWGFATGEILEIGKDVEFLGDIPVFKVRCSIDNNYLELKNGFRGTLRKGMTFNANFKLIERSLYDLLYDKMDDWFNPTKTETSKSQFLESRK
ncbi:HlyD family efflux transporter periplasmic adaptor subunit [Ulvibacterium sp.]|uniref:HlyD family secretion protein n=1 Tax=Ulvibacterium sp. TaxID=2665914 RepID=UPI002635D1BB|nr:HlyD family efflux transporter periplasmic adaptor subunit [Ulvibacterium sp.]